MVAEHLLCQTPTTSRQPTSRQVSSMMFRSCCSNSSVCFLRLIDSMVGSRWWSSMTGQWIWNINRLSTWKHLKRAGVKKQRMSSLIYICLSKSFKHTFLDNPLSQLLSSIQEGRTVQGWDQTCAALGLFFFLLSHWLHLFFLGWWFFLRCWGELGDAKRLELHRASSLWTTFQKPQLEMCPGNARDGIAAST